MLNTAILMGRLTAEPELRHTPNNVAVTAFTLAVDRSYVKAGEERETDWIEVVCWRSTAEFVSKYFRKGQLIAVQGSIQTRNYTDKEGNKRKAVEIIADSVYFAEPKKDRQAAGTAPTIEADDGPQFMQSGFEEVPADEDLPF